MGTIFGQPFEIPHFRYFFVYFPVFSVCGTHLLPHWRGVFALFGCFSNHLRDWQGVLPSC